MFLNGIILILLAILASSSFIIKMKPSAKPIIDSLTPFQGGIGLIACIWGIWIIIKSSIGLSFLGLLSGIVTACLGLILGYSLISTLILSRNKTALSKGQMLKEKIAVYQVPMGFAAFGLGVYSLIRSFI